MSALKKTATTKFEEKNYDDLIRRLSICGEELMPRSPVVKAILFSGNNGRERKLRKSSGSSAASVSDGDTMGSALSTASTGPRSPGGKTPPARSRTMKEYDEQLSDLKKENFSLKLRVYFLEERMGQKYNALAAGGKEDLYKANIELKVEMEALKNDLFDKQDLIRQASAAILGIEQQYEEQLTQLRHQHQQELAESQLKLELLQKEMDDHSEKCLGGDSNLTQLCGLAFSNGADEECLTFAPLMPGTAKTGATPMRGIFSLTDEDQCKESSSATTVAETVSPSQVVTLEGQVAKLEDRVRELECELKQKKEANEILQGDIANLKLELEEKAEKIVDLEIDLADKELKLDTIMQELETRHMEIVAKDSQIMTLNDDLQKVEPEIEIKVQEIVERDRIIERKIEQIEQQNRIIVEIQITLDEKQKQIGEMEASLSEAEGRAEKLREEVERGCQTIQGFTEQVENRDKEIILLKKELKRKEKKIRDLVAELKEALEMMNRAKWEAETSGGEDGVKEMAEEENERLWAELEQRKSEVLSLRAEHAQAMAAAQQQCATMQIQIMEMKAEKGQEDGEGRVGVLEAELKSLKEAMVLREGQWMANQTLVEGLKEELSAVRKELKGKRIELHELMQNGLKGGKSLQQNDTGGELAILQERLSSQLTSHRQEVETLKDQLAAHQGELRRLRQRLTACSCSEAATDMKAVARNPSMTNMDPGTNILAVLPRPLHVTFVNNGDTGLERLCYDLNRGNRGEVVGSEMVERKDTNDMAYRKNSILTKDENATQIASVKENEKISDNELEVETLANLQKQLQVRHDEIQRNATEMTQYRVQVNALREELRNARKKLHQQQVPDGKYYDAAQVRRYKQEIASLRTRLADSHTACDALRTRLEELADFLERILEMDSQGLVNLSLVSSPQHLAAIHRTLDESRALSRSLSQSLMIGVDSMVGEDLLSSSVSSVSSAWSLPPAEDESCSEAHVESGCMGTCGEHPEVFCGDETMTGSTSHCEENHNILDPVYHTLASEMAEQIEMKAREIEGVVEKVSLLSDKLMEKTAQVEQQAAVIVQLRSQIESMEVENAKQLNLDGQKQLVSLSAELTHEERENNANCHMLSDITPLLPLCGSTSDCHSASASGDSRAKDSNTHRRVPSVSSEALETLPPPPFDMLLNDENQSTQVDSQKKSFHSELQMLKKLTKTDGCPKIGSAVFYSGDHFNFQQSNVQSHQSSNQLRQFNSQCGLNMVNSGLITCPLTSVTLVSPTEESECWSEPDRNVSQARIGLDSSSLCSSERRPWQPHRAADIDSSDDSADNGLNTRDSMTAQNASGSSSKAGSKRRSNSVDISKVDTSSKGKSGVEQLGNSERGTAEQYSFQVSSNQTPQTVSSDKNKKSSAGSINTRSSQGTDVFKRPHPPQMGTLPSPMLDEMRGLRLTLKEAIANNDHLRDQLESALSCQRCQHPDESRLNHLSVALKTEQEEHSECREQLRSLKTRQQEEHQRSAELHRQKCDLQRQVAALEGDMQEFRTREQRLQEDLTQAYRTVGDKDRAVRDYGLTIEQKEELLRDLKSQLSKESCTVEKLKSELHDKESRLAQVLAEHQRVQNEQISMKNEMFKLKDQLEKTLKEKCQELSQLNILRQELASTEQETVRLKALWEAEQCICADLRRRLEACRCGNGPMFVHSLRTCSSQADSSSGLASPESATSFEFYRPTSLSSFPTANGMTYQSRLFIDRSPTSLPAKGESGGMSKSQRVLWGNWGDDKENSAPAGGIGELRSDRSKVAQGSVSSKISHLNFEAEDEEVMSGASPDLGIGSDQHFSSLERMKRHSTGQNLQPRRCDSLCTEPGHKTLGVEMDRLRCQRDDLYDKLTNTKETLADALEKLARANQRKESVERAICRQLSKTHGVLQKAKSNLQEAKAKTNLQS